MRNNEPNGCFTREWDLVMSMARGFCGAAGATAGGRHWHAAEAMGGWRREAEVSGNGASQGDRGAMPLPGTQGNRFDAPRRLPGTEADGALSRRQTARPSPETKKEGARAVKDTVGTARLLLVDPTLRRGGGCW